MFFATLWPLLVSEASRGIVGFLQRDLFIPPTVIVVLILFSIGIAWRGVYARWWMLALLLGQGTYALAAFVYAIHSDITWTQFAGHGGLFFLGAAGICSAIPVQMSVDEQGRAEPKKNLHNRMIAVAQALLIPIIGVALLIYAIGLAARPDAGVAAFIQTQYGLHVMGFIGFFMAIGAAVAIQNNISAGRLAVALTPQGVYAFIAIELLGSDNNVSFAGVIVHLLFCFTAFLVVMIRTRDHANTLRRRRSERQRGATA
jgi:hypothetical protein